MKKSKLSLGLIACLLSVGTLAGCDKIKSSKEGVLLSYTVDGVPGQITADGILKDYYNDSTKYQAIYDTLYSVIARNYFSKDRGTINYHGEDIPLGKEQMKKIERDAKEKVDNDKDTAQTNADANNTKYKKELEAILESKGVEDVDELFDKYVEELQKTTFENNFYTYFIDEIKSGNKGQSISVKSLYKDPEEAEYSELFKWNGYLEDQIPYHISHILVKLSDSSDTNYHNGTISEENAERLYNVVDALGSKSKKFAKVAMTYNEDPGSKDKEGDLGIMDYDTSFINEFKLGIYAYEQFYNKNYNATETARIAASRINIITTEDDDIGDRYQKEVKELFDLGSLDAIPSVDKSVFDELKAVAKDDKDEDGKPVIENATLVYPRNIIYNKYLNKHAVFLLSDTTAGDDATNGNYVANWNGSGLNVLCADDDPTKPIVAVRASSGGEQEIHLMVVNRSPFAGADNAETGERRVVNNVSLDDYYTTFYPDQDYYPTKDGKKLDTYVNFLSNDTSETKNRAEEFASKLKSYDSDKLGKYIFLKYANEEQIKFADENQDLAKALMKWIKTSLEKSAEEKDESWTKTWNEYLDKLVRQNQERSKLVPEACKLVYKKGNSSANPGTFLTAAQLTELNDALVAAGFNAEIDDTDPSNLLIKIDGEAIATKDLYKVEGGLCNDGKAHL